MIQVGDRIDRHVMHQSNSKSFVHHRVPVIGHGYGPTCSLSEDLRFTPWPWSWRDAHSYHCNQRVQTLWSLNSSADYHWHYCSFYNTYILLLTPSPWKRKTLQMSEHSLCVHPARPLSVPRATLFRCCCSLMCVSLCGGDPYVWGNIRLDLNCVFLTL